MKRRGNTPSKCTNCGKNIMVFPYELKMQRKMFCGQKCKYKWLGLYMRGENHPAWQGGDLAMKCPQCLKSFIMPRAHRLHGKNHFCSHKCADKYRGEHMRKENHPRWTGGLIICTGCGKSFLKSGTWIRSQQRHNTKLGIFHSMDCWHEWAKKNWTGEINPCWKREKIKCINCGKEIVRVHHRIKGLNFCSNECAGIYRVGENSQNWEGGGIECKCALCGKQFMRSKAEYRSYRKHGIFCSDKCRAIGVSAGRFWERKVDEIPKDVINFWNLLLSVKRKLRAKEVPNGTRS